MASSKYGIPKLSDNNYFTWKIRMHDFLVIKDCQEAITVADHPASAKALAFIRTYIEDEYLPIIKDLSNAQAAWKALQEVFQARSTACLLLPLLLPLPQLPPPRAAQYTCGTAA